MRTERLTYLYESHITLQKEKVVLLQQLVDVKDELLQLKDQLLEEKDSRLQDKQDLFRVQYENKDLERTLLRLQNRFNIRGLLEYIASKHASNISGGVQAQLNDIHSRPEFRAIFNTITTRRTLRAADVQRCLKGIYHSMSKHFHAAGLGNDPEIVIDTTPGGPGTVLSPGDGAAIETLLHYHVVPYIRRHGHESSMYVQHGGRLVEKVEPHMKAVDGVDTQSRAISYRKRTGLLEQLK